MCLLGKYIIKGEEDNSECQEIADSGMQIGNPHSEQIFPNSLFNYCIFAVIQPIFLY
jgi:hypothetical protein